MHIIEIANLLKKIRPKLEFQRTILNTGNAKKNYLNGLTKFRLLIQDLAAVPALDVSLEPISKSSIFQTDSDELYITDQELGALDRQMEKLHFALDAIISLGETSDSHEDHIRIKLPPFQTFEDLQKLSGDLKLAIEIPLKNSKLDTSVSINKLEPGSTWLVIGLGVRLATQFLADLANLALNIRMKKSESDKHMEYAKQIKANTEMLDAISKLTRESVDQYLNEQTKQLQNKYFDQKKSNDILNVIKTSTETFANLYEKGMIIQSTIPSATQNDKNLVEFPSLDKIRSIKEGVKQISPGENDAEEKTENPKIRKHNHVNKSPIQKKS
ncbi:hypothetical protein [Parapedobacter sp. DT-150]|uniref:hypothetical protein n=1 Tax=Parapedobacter sp. DT-150 TaxID=3396162 RepID=UPI003F1AF0B0